MNDNERKKNRVSVRMSDTQLRKIERAAKRQHHSVSKFMRLASVQEAERTEPDDPHAEARRERARATHEPAA